MTLADEELDLTFAALADGTRRAILARLSVGEATVNDLAEPFSISLQAVSKHLKVLERAGLITRSRDAQWRPCRLELPPLENASAWIDEHRREWERRLDVLGDVVESLKRDRPKLAAPGMRQGDAEVPGRAGKVR